MIKHIMLSLFLRARHRSLATLLDAGMLESYSLSVRGGRITEVAVVLIPGARLRMTGAGAAGIARMEARRRWTG